MHTVRNVLSTGLSAEWIINEFLGYFRENSDSDAEVFINTFSVLNVDEIISLSVDKI